MVYRGKIDWWIGLALGAGGTVAPLGGLLVASQLMFMQPVAAVIFGLLMLTTGAMIWWILLGTYYAITPEHLIIRCGPFGRTIALDSITEVEDRRNLLDFEPGWGFALSIDRFHVRWQKKNGKPGLCFKISPKDKLGFARELAQRITEQRAMTNV